MTAPDDLTIELRVNGRQIRANVPPRMSLADFLRERRGLTGTHLGCGQGVCGSCNVLLDSRSVRACLVLAVQADAAEVVTIEGLSDSMEPSAVQACLVRHRGLQCGFCTPGFVVLIEEILAAVVAGDRPTPAELRDRLAGSLCRCTGYAPIIAATEVLVAATIVRATR